MHKSTIKLLFFLFVLIFAVSGFLLSQETKESISNIRYEIWVELDDENKMLYGRENISFFNKTRDDIHDIWLHLYYNAFKNEQSTLQQEAKEQAMDFMDVDIEDGEWGWIDVKSIRLADGTDLAPTMEFIVQDEPLHVGDQTVMRVRLPQPLLPNEEVHLKLEFESKIPRRGLRTGYYKTSYFLAQWFPKPGVYEEGKGWNCHEYHLSSEFFADFADFMVHITVPEEFVIGASGKQIKTEPDREKKTVTYTYIQENIHDFAWTADPKFVKIERDFITVEEVSHKEYEEVAHILQLPVEEIKLPDVKMILLIAPEHKAQIDRHFNALKAAIKYYGLWYGPYPYETITMVDPPFRTGSAGMEYPTLFTAGTSILKSKKVLSPEGVIIHEFGHGYWYGLCANNEFEEAWLDEGLNTYSTGKVQSKAYGPGVFSISFNRMPLVWFFRFPQYNDYELERAVALHVVEHDPITTFSWQFYDVASYGLNVYQRASICLYTLERLIGEDVMLRILRTFQMRFRYKHPHTQDFINVVSEVTGRDMSWFFEELFFNTLNFDYGLASLKTREKKKYVRGIFDMNGRKEELTSKKIEEMEKKDNRSEDVKSYITELRVRRYGEARVRGDTLLKIEVVFEDGSKETRFWKGQERWKKYTFVKPVRAKYAQLDPDNIWLIDSNLANNSLKRKPSKKGIWRVTSQLLFAIQNYLHFLASLS